LHVAFAQYARPDPSDKFTRRNRLPVADFDLWVVSKEDLILSKLHWAKESQSGRQRAD